jgi:hypothetical protein
MGTDLAKEPLITAGALARLFGVGANTVNAMIERLGIKPARLANSRLYLSFDQAQRINGEMTKRMRK